jgi:hypothetical protein
MTIDRAVVLFSVAIWCIAISSLDTGRRLGGNFQNSREEFREVGGKVIPNSRHHDVQSGFQSRTVYHPIHILIGTVRITGLQIIITHSFTDDALHLRLPTLLLSVYSSRYLFIYLNWVDT